MDENAIIALVIVGTILILIGMACCVRKSADLQGEAIKTDYEVGKRSRRDRELEQRFRGGRNDVDGIAPVGPVVEYPIVPPPPPLQLPAPIYPINPGIPGVPVYGAGVLGGWNQPWGRNL